MVSLRQEVQDLQQKKREAEEANQLLKQLKALWEQTLREVEAEFLEGVKKQSGLISLDSASSAADLISSVADAPASGERKRCADVLPAAAAAGRAKSRRIVSLQQQKQQQQVAFQA